MKVKTDKKAALTLAQLHAVGMLEGVWIPPEPVRDLRAVIAQREKMVLLYQYRNEIPRFYGLIPPALTVMAGIFLALVFVVTDWRFYRRQQAPDF